MSLEKALQENTAALVANTEALLAVNAGREKALEAAASLKTTARREEPKEEAEADEKPVRRAAAKAEPKAKAKPARAPTLDQLKSAAGVFLAAEDEVEGLDEDEAQEVRDARTDFLVAMLAEFGVKKVTEIEKSDGARAIDLMERKAAGEDVSFGEDQDTRKSLID